MGGGQRSKDQSGKSFGGQGRLLASLNVEPEPRQSQLPAAFVEMHA